MSTVKKSGIFMLAGLCLAFSASTAFAGQVITWVGPDKVEASKNMLQRDFGGVGMKDGLTYLALQFWAANGPEVVRDWEMPPDFDNQVAWFRDWGQAHGIQVTLCVTNARGTWTWSEALRSFKENRSAFVKALVAEVDRLGLDGVELDLESGEDANSGDSVYYTPFVKELASALHAKNKVLTVASFAFIYHAPNWTWWEYLMPHVDGIASMGYEDAGKNSPGGFNYGEQKKHTAYPQKLMLGMPAYARNVDNANKPEWQGNTPLEHIEWVKSAGEVGVGIWEASLPAGGEWHSSAVWEALRIIKNTKSSAIRTTLATPLQPKDATGRYFDLKGMAINPEVLSLASGVYVSRGRKNLEIKVVKP